MAAAMGFFTDVTVCIGCKACEVACKMWNQLPANEGGVVELSGDSYDNTRTLDGTTWRHVRFVEDINVERTHERWLMMSDVCKHCVQAGCLEICPTGAIIRTEFDTVVIQSSACNGCRNCIPACPFDVIGINETNNTAMKCTLCYDRLQAGMVPACAQACPTESIMFGPVQELRRRADVRVAELHQQGMTDAYIYGDESMLGGLNAFFLLAGEPEWYGLPRDPQLPTRNLIPNTVFGTISAIVVAILGLFSFRKVRMDDNARAPERQA
jgi:formate dehydrogenase iron-sulfur subunit